MDPDNLKRLRAAYAFSKYGLSRSHLPKHLTCNYCNVQKNLALKTFRGVANIVEENKTASTKSYLSKGSLKEYNDRRLLSMADGVNIGKTESCNTLLLTRGYQTNLSIRSSFLLIEGVWVVRRYCLVIVASPVTFQDAKLKSQILCQTPNMQRFTSWRNSRDSTLQRDPHSMTQTKRILPSLSMNCSKGSEKLT